MRNHRPETNGAGTAATIIPLPAADARPKRVLAADEPKGVILLFTGVRYERTDMDHVPTPPVASNGARRRRS